MLIEDFRLRNRIFTLEKTIKLASLNEKLVKNSIKEESQGVDYSDHTSSYSHAADGNTHIIVRNTDFPKNSTSEFCT